MIILVVDDDMGTVNALRAHLASTGHQVLTARDGRQALNVVESSIQAAEPVDLMVTDFKMPGMTGLELIRAVRKADQVLPAILMTAYGDDSLRRRATEEGCCGYLDKPFSPETLLSEIERLEQGPERDG